MAETTTHPLVAYADRHGLTRRQAAKHFRIEYGVFRQIVTGHVGVSFKRALLYAARSNGEFNAMDLLVWHQHNAKSRAA